MINSNVKHMMAYLLFVAVMGGSITFSIEKSYKQDAKIARIAAAENRDRELATALVCSFGNKTAQQVNNNSLQLHRPQALLPLANCSKAVEKARQSSK